MNLRGPSDLELRLKAHLLVLILVLVTLNFFYLTSHPVLASYLSNLKRRDEKGSGAVMRDKEKENRSHWYLTP